MGTTIPNLDENAYRALCDRAVMEGRAIETLMAEAIRVYLARPAGRRTSSLRLLRPEPYPPGNQGLSSEIDEIVYGRRE